LSAEQKAIEIFAQIMRDGRSQLPADRGKFANIVGTTRDVMVALEHNNPPRARRLLRHMIVKARLCPEDKHRAYEQLRIFCPRRWEQRKLHLPITILRPRNIRR
jgi:hypothetical protein